MKRAPLARRRVWTFKTDSFSASTTTAIAGAKCVGSHHGAVFANGAAHEAEFVRPAFDEEAEVRKLEATDWS
jgi:hypothetical protein